MRRPRLGAAALAALFGAAACGGAGAQPAPPAGRPGAAAGPSVTVVEVRGAVLALRGDAWRPAEPGLRLQAGEAVKTDELGEAVLRLEPDTRLRLWQDTEVTVQGRAPGRWRLRLERGRLGAVVGASRRLEVEGAGSGALARAAEGRFSVFSSGAGLVVVAEGAAPVRLATEGGDEVLAAGRALVLADAGLPRRPIPESVLRSVAWPAPEPPAPDPDAADGTLAEVDALGRPTRRAPLRIDAADLLRRRAGHWRVRVFRDGSRIRVESENP